LKGAGAQETLSRRHPLGKYYVINRRQRGKKNTRVKQGRLVWRNRWMHNSNGGHTNEFFPGNYETVLRVGEPDDIFL